MDVPRKGKDRNVHQIIRATGAAYTIALAEVRRRSAIGQLKTYMDMIKATPDWQEGNPVRCVHCLMNAHGKCEL